MQMNESTADKVISQDQMSCAAQTYLRTDENMRILDFSIEIQQAEGQHINNLEEMLGNIHKGVGILDSSK